MSEPQMTKEALDEIERLIVSGNPSDALALAPEPVLKIIALAREGLRLREPPIDGDYLRQLHKEFDCGCETCARTAAVCPATASSLFQEVAILREHRDRLTAELKTANQNLAALDSAMNREYQDGKGDKRSGDLLDDFREFLDHHKRKEVELDSLRKDGIHVHLDQKGCSILLTMIEFYRLRLDSNSPHGQLEGAFCVDLKRHLIEAAAIDSAMRKESK